LTSRQTFLILALREPANGSHFPGIARSPTESIYGQQRFLLRHIRHEKR